MSKIEDDYLEGRDYQQCDTVAVITANLPLKVRAEASAKGNVLGEIFPEQEFLFLRSLQGDAYRCGPELCYSWTEIDYGGNSAYVASFYVSRRCAAEP
ncbi:MAG: hypothetical protein IPJ88_17175 [Myxococcales bacterium]|nr:MAG: hypothetical protein IPJ88_17175 [Myxococcales bacterium]